MGGDDTHKVAREHSRIVLRPEYLDRAREIIDD